MTTLSYHIDQYLEQYKTMFEKIIILTLDLPEIFEEMDVNNFGRAVAFLTYVYVLKGSEDVTRKAARLVAPILRDVNITRVDESFSKECFLGSDACLRSLSRGPFINNTKRNETDLVCT